MSPFSARFFWGTQKRGLLLPRRAAALWEGPRKLWRGAVKAEDAKLPGAGISPTQCPRKWEAEKGGVPDSVPSPKGARGVMRGARFGEEAFWTMCAARLKRRS